MIFLFKKERHLLYSYDHEQKQRTKGRYGQSYPIPASQKDNQIQYKSKTFTHAQERCLVQSRGDTHKRFTSQYSMVKSV